MEDHHRVGKLIFFLSCTSIVVWLLLSSGYREESGVLTNFYYHMMVVNFELTTIESLCSETDAFSSGVLGVFPYKKRECFGITIWTRHLVLLSVLIGAYGLLIWNRLIPNPAPYISKKINSWCGKDKPD